MLVIVLFACNYFDNFFLIFFANIKLLKPKSIILVSFILIFYFSSSLSNIFWKLGSSQNENVILIMVKMKFVSMNGICKMKFWTEVYKKNKIEQKKQQKEMKEMKWKCTFKNCMFNFKNMEESW